MELFVPVTTKRTKLSKFCDITGAIFIREARRRFGKYKFGMFWAIFEPAVHVMVFTIILSFRQSSIHANTAIPYFVLTGIIPFLLFKLITKQVMNAAKANQSAFTYPIVGVFHTVVARVLLELAIYVTSFVFLLFIFTQFWAFDLRFPSLFQIMILVGAIVISAASIGIVLMVVRRNFPSIEKIFDAFFRILYFTSGVFFAASQIPEPYLSIIQYNPILHVVELFRFYFIGTQASLGNPMYILYFTLGSVLVASYAYNKKHRELKKK